jgi:hypothetical protein
MVEPVSADSSPTFRVQLDDRDPVRTVMTDHTFTGLKEGPHELFVMILDANDNPIPGARTVVHFRVPPPQGPHSGSPRAEGKVRARAGRNASQAPAFEAASSEGKSARSNRPLPLLAVLGGGALAGGTLSVLRTRGRRKRS